MESNKDKSLNSLVLLLASPIIMFLLVINTAYPAMLVWNLWIPNYFVLQALTLPYAVMFCLTFVLFRGSKTQRTEDNRSDETKVKDIILTLIAPWILYLTALVTYKFFIL